MLLRHTYFVFCFQKMRQKRTPVKSRKNINEVWFTRKAKKTPVVYEQHQRHEMKGAIVLMEKLTSDAIEAIKEHLKSCPVVHEEEDRMKIDPPLVLMKKMSVNEIEVMKAKLKNGMTSTSTSKPKLIPILKKSESNLRKVPFHFVRNFEKCDNVEFNKEPIVCLRKLTEKQIKKMTSPTKATTNKKRETTYTITIMDCEDNVSSKGQQKKKVRDVGCQTPKIPSPELHYCAEEDGVVINGGSTFIKHVSHKDNRFDQEWTNEDLMSEPIEGDIKEHLLPAKVITVNQNIKKVKIRHWSAVFSVEFPESEFAPENPILMDAENMA